MRKNCIYSFLLLITSCYFLNAQNSGIFEAFVITKANSDPNFYNKLTNDGTGFGNANLGTFDCGETLLLNGGQNKTFKCPPDDIFDGSLYYRVYLQALLGEHFFL